MIRSSAWQFNLGANSICSVYTFSLLIALLSRTDSDAAFAPSSASHELTSATKPGRAGATAHTRSNFGAISVHVQEHIHVD